MRRNGNGAIELTPRALVGVVVAALALGGAGVGGSWFFAKPAPAAPAIEARIAVIETRQAERDKALERRLEAIEESLKGIERMLRWRGMRPDGE